MTTNKTQKKMLYINMWKIRPSLFDLFPSSDITGCTSIKFEHVVIIFELDIRRSSYILVSHISISVSGALISFIICPMKISSFYLIVSIVTSWKLLLNEIIACDLSLKVMSTSLQFLYIIKNM